MLRSDDRHIKYQVGSFRDCCIVLVETDFAAVLEGTGFTDSVVCAEHHGADRYSAFRIWEAAASEIADAVRLRRFEVNRRHISGDGIDVRPFLDHMDDEMSGSVSRERETFGIHTAMFAVVV